MDVGAYKGNFRSCSDSDLSPKNRHSQEDIARACMVDVGFANGESLNTHNTWGIGERKGLS